MCVHAVSELLSFLWARSCAPPGENGTFQSLCGFLSDVPAGIFGPFSTLYVWVHVSDAFAWLLGLTLCAILCSSK